MLSVQISPSSQLTIVPSQLPVLVHRVLNVHASPSSQIAPSLGVFVQPSPFASQKSAVQSLASSQLAAVKNVAGTQFPLVHVSPVVQAFPSSQMDVLSVVMHPIAVSQTLSVQGFSSLQETGMGEAIQPPEKHCSPSVHALSSSQIVPCATLSFTQPSGISESQLSTVHSWLSSQSGAMPPTQIELVQASEVVHSSPSLQDSVLGINWHPSVPATPSTGVGLQLSSVQGFKSSHTTPSPTHAPSKHVSREVHALPSLQTSLLGRNTQPTSG